MMNKELNFSERRELRAVDAEAYAGQILNQITTPLAVFSDEGALIWENASFSKLAAGMSVTHLRHLLDDEQDWKIVRIRMLRYRQVNLVDVKLRKSLANYNLVTTRGTDLGGRIIAELKDDTLAVSALKMKSQALARERTRELAAKKLSEYRELSRLDYLTGVYNRKALDAKLADKSGLARAHRTQLSLLLIDIDNFKSINDTYGHQCGDTVLKKVARLIHEAAERQEDFAARYGGDEFALVLYATDIFGVIAIARKLLASVNRLKFPELEGFDHSVSISMGCATLQQCMNNPGIGLLEMADRALLTAKASGRNRMQIYKSRS